MINLESLEIKTEISTSSSIATLSEQTEIVNDNSGHQIGAIEINAGDDSKFRAEIELWKNRCAAITVEKELALALSGESLLPGVTGQLIQLLRDRVVIKFNDKNGLEVVSTDGRVIADSVKDWLKQPEFLHFRPAITRGGTASRTETQVTERNLGDINKEKSLNEIVINQWRQRQNQQTGLVHKPTWPKN